MFSYIHNGQRHENVTEGYMKLLGMNDETIQSVLNQMEYEMSSNQHGSKLTRLAFMQRFTQSERVAIRQAAKAVPEIEDYLAMVDAATFIDLARPDTISSVNALASAQLITQARAVEIITQPVTAAEAYN